MWAGTKKWSLDIICRVVTLLDADGDGSCNGVFGDGDVPVRISSSLYANHCVNTGGGSCTTHDCDGDRMDK